MLTPYNPYPTGLAVYIGSRCWRVLPPMESPGQWSASPPLAMVRDLGDDGFRWDWPVAPAVSR